MVIITVDMYLVPRSVEIELRFGEAFGYVKLLRLDLFPDGVTMFVVDIFRMYCCTLELYKLDLCQ